MIAHIQGRLVDKSPTELVIDCQGVGYALQISLYTFAKLPEQDHVFLHTHLAVREDAQVLYGFIDKAERELFRLLIGVAGIGPNTARSILSSTEPEALSRALCKGEVAVLQRIKGIGAKTAQRMVLELQEKMLKNNPMEAQSLGLHNNHREEALTALEVLGFARKASEKWVDLCLKVEPDASVETLIKQALKNL